MSFREAVAKLDKVKPFVGGNDIQRAHLNAMGDIINAIIDGAKGDTGAIEQLLKGMERRPFYAEENGEPALYQIPAQKQQDPQP